MSAQNGERARFHRNRKRRVLQRMRSRAAFVTLKEQAQDRAQAQTATAATVTPARGKAGGPALQAGK